MSDRELVAAEGLVGTKTRTYCKLVYNTGCSIDATMSVVLFENNISSFLPTFQEHELTGFGKSLVTGA